MRKITVRRLSKPKHTVMKATIREANKKNKNRTKVAQPFISAKKSKNYTG
jgi:hypothetical protein